MSIWVVAEHRNGQVREVTGELLAAARALGVGPVTLLLLGGAEEVDGLRRELPAGADHVLCVASPHLAGFNGTATAEALRCLAVERPPRLILGAHTAAGMDWAPTLAAKLRAPVVTDAVGLELDGADLRATRTVYGGKLNARVRLAGAAPAVATLRPGSAEASAPGGEPPATETLDLDLPATLGKRFLGWVQDAVGDVDIGQADILVSVGRGIGDRENLDLAEGLATALGATVSCSRPVVDLGWLPKERQVGISGKTVKPKVYIALGISGAFQHVTAMQGADLVLAVNKDPRAPIFRVAHYGVVGDLFKIVPPLTRAIREARSAGG